jgi:hypothetical protein
MKSGELRDEGKGANSALAGLVYHDAGVSRGAVPRAKSSK